MSVRVRGIDKVLDEMQKRYGKEAMQEKTDRALKKASEAFKGILVEEFQTFRDTGASIDEIELMAPRTINGARTIIVRWRGPKDRYRIIHLNEFGTVKNPNPRGKGAVARALKRAERIYAKVLAEELRR